MRKKILVTGAAGSGFIGRNVAEFLAERYEVSAPGRAELDLTDETAVRDYLKAGRFDCIVHSATGKTNRKMVVPELFKINCRMFFNLARNHDLFGKMLHYGSGAEFGVRVPRMAETFFDAHVPKDDYGFAKYIATQYTDAAGAAIYNLRLFGVFGKYEVWDVRFISNAICRVLFDMPITMRQNVRFDYLHVDDVARVTEWFVENTPAQHKTFNVCRGEAYELRALAEMIADVSGKKPKIVVKAEGLGAEYSGDNTRLRETIEGLKFGEMKEQIAELYRWYEAHRGEIDATALRFDE